MYSYIHYIVQEEMRSIVQEEISRFYHSIDQISGNLMGVIIIISFFFLSYDVLFAYMHDT